MLKNGKKRLIIVRRRQQKKLSLRNRWAEPPSYSLFLPTSLKGCCSWGITRYGYPWLSILSAIPDSVSIGQFSALSDCGYTGEIPISWISDKTQSVYLLLHWASSPA